MDCYGRSYGKSENCRVCRLRRWCATAADPVMMCNFMAPYDDTRGSGSASSFEHPALEEREEKHDGRRKFYTRREMLKVIRALLKMDLATIDILYEKLKEPALKITNLGRRKHLPRQRIYSHLHKAFSIIPDLREAVNVEYGFNISGS